MSRFQEILRALADQLVAAGIARAGGAGAEADAELQRVIADQAAWLEQEVQARTAEMSQQKREIEQAHSTLSVLGEIGREITATLDEAEVCQTLNRHVHDLLDAMTFAIYRMDPDGLGLTSILRVEEGAPLPVARIELDNPVRYAARCARERSELTVDSGPDQDDPSHVPGTARMQSAMFAPLAIGERLLGVMTIQSARRHAYGDREQQVFRTLCAYGAIALDNAGAYQRLTEADAEVERVLRERQQWLEQEVQARTAEVVRQKEDLEQAHATLSVLGEIGREITATLDEGALFSSLERRVCDLLDAAAIGIYRLDEAGEALDSVLFMEAGHPLPPERIPLDDPNRHAARCARERCELLLDFAPEEDDPSHIPGTLETLSALFAPLAIGERLLGVMTIQSLNRHAYGKREQQVFRTLCAYGAIALDNAAAYRRLAEADAGVQRMLLEQQLIFDNVAVAIFFVKDRVVRRCNRGLEEMLGYGPGELIDQPTRIYHPSDESWKALGEEIYPTVNAGEVAEGEWEIVRKDGTPIWIAYRGRAVVPGDEAEGTIWVAQDITERKRTAAALDRALREQRALFENAGGGIMLSRDRAIVRGNRGMEQMLGYGPGELDGMPTRGFFRSEAEYDDLFARALPVLSTGGIAQGEVEYRRKDGDFVWLVYYGKAIDPSDLGQGIVWSGLDISAQKQVQAALKKSLQEFEALFANFTGGIAIVRGGVFHRCNRRFEEMLGFGPGEALGLPEQQGFVPPEQWGAFVAAHAAAIEGGAVASGESEYVRRDGERCWVQYQVRMIDAADPSQGVLWFGQDISERRRAEAELERIRREQRTIFDSTPGGILLTRDRIIIGCNPGLEILLGHPVGSLAGRPTRVYFPSDEAHAAFGQWAYPVLVAGGTASGEIDFVDANGALIPAYIAGRALDPSDLSQGVVWMATDLRQQKAAAAELDRTRRELQVIFDNMTGGLWITRDSHIHRCNLGFERMFGLPAGAGVGKKVDIGFLGEDAYRDFVNRTTPDILAGRVVTGEIEFERADGRRRWMLYQGKALDPQDMEQGTIWFGHDITERKLDETAVREANERLARGLAEVEQLNCQVTLLGELTGFLQACPNASEAFACVDDFGPRLFPGSDGVLYLAADDGRTWVEHGHWGRPATNDQFAGDDCWALRRSRAYRVDAPGMALCCPHVRAHGHGRAYACLPLTAQGKTFGLLHVAYADTGLPADACERRHGLAVAMADQIALAIANVQLRDALLQQSIRDPLTGLYNRRHLQDGLFRELARCKREQLPAALLMVDVDHFKRCNDTHGHPAGDAVLQAVAKVLESKVRQGELACRFGGEEFAVLLPGGDVEVAMRVGERILEGVRALAPTHENRPLGGVTVSLGAAVFPQDGSTPQSLLEAADAALYAAKKQGRDRLVAAARE